MNTEQHLALSALGPDRPGLVAEITGFLREHGANIEDSRMAILGSDFGALVLISGTADQLAAIAREIQALERKTGLGFITRPTNAPTSHRARAGAPALVLAEALDHEGIVYAIADTLQKLGANIVSLQATAYNAPVTGAELFRMDARVDLPSGMTVGQLRRAMEDLSVTRNLDIDVRTAV